MSGAIEKRFCSFSIVSGGLSLRHRILKRMFDIVFSIMGIGLTWWILLLAYAAASIDTGQSGLFRQKRVGRYGRSFTVLKLRTMRSGHGGGTTITTAGDPRITRLGAFFRKTKLDELPQLVNILLGQMSFVGPRPDVPGYADRLVGEDRVILTVRPGMTGPATLKYRNEEQLLAESDDPVKYNDEVIYPDKVRINREYVLEYSFVKDVKYLIQTMGGK